jgi:hypothetical protein
MLPSAPRGCYDALPDYEIDRSASAGAQKTVFAKTARIDVSAE